MEGLFMTFLVYSFIGFLWETLYCSLKARHFVYRGFLLGPYCPVYGVGVCAVLWLVPQNAGSLINLYFNMIVIVTVIEFVTSWILEKWFHMTLWDYSHVPLNIEGRVAIPVSLFWGAGCLVLVKIINPFIQIQIERIETVSHLWIPIILFTLFLLDVITTLIFTNTTKKEVASTIDLSDSNNAGIKEYRLHHLLSNRKSSVGREKILDLLKDKPKNWRYHNLNRIVQNYPNVKFKKHH